MSYLKTTVVGFLGNDCRVNTVNGKDVINFSVAYSEKFKDASGQQKEKTLWINASYWPNSTAVAQYLKKGTLILAEGIPDVSIYTDNNRQQRAEFKLRVSGIKLLSGKNENNGSSPTQNSGNQQSQANSYTNANEITEPLDDLPF